MKTMLSGQNCFTALTLENCSSTHYELNFNFFFNLYY